MVSTRHWLSAIAVAALVTAGCSDTTDQAVEGLVCEGADYAIVRDKDLVVAAEADCRKPVAGAVIRVTAADGSTPFRVISDSNGRFALPRRALDVKGGTFSADVPGGGCGLAIEGATGSGGFLDVVTERVVIGLPETACRAPAKS